MGAVKTTARRSGSGLVVLIIVLLSILAGFLILNFFVGGATSILGGLVDAIFGGIISVVEKIAAGIAKVFITIIGLPFEIIFNTFIRGLNVIPGINFDFIDMTGDGLCTGSGLAGSACA